MSDLSRFQVTCDESTSHTLPQPEAARVFTMTMPLPWLSTAKQARECGCKIPDGIPDHAVYKPPGVFEYEIRP